MIRDIAMEKKNGQEDGKKSEQIEIAKKMKENNIDIETIIKCTGLTRRNRNVII